MDPERCEHCGGSDLSVEFIDDYRRHLHPECVDAWRAQVLASRIDAED